MYVFIILDPIKRIFSFEGIEENKNEDDMIEFIS